MVKLDGILLKQMIISGSNNIFNSYPDIDALNVFPVPDGDTGTNMNLTMSSGAKKYLLLMTAIYIMLLKHSVVDCS